ncbi:hypothetical protein [Brevibacillus fulvus]|uniref:FixJ family two-component response regulator n=1 Tax=Brevibacillus fulvus TaxID=1125967 RepID=A0A938XXI0_9BACL|nr:hypothetical protein [Brevibacillus fulvus]MBM7588764.1 FixJ family two-component response regulator [Brevibacillus fulvus]
MEKRRKSDALWVTPGVFSGSLKIEEAVGRISSVSQLDWNPKPVEDSQLKSQIEMLAQQIQQLQAQLAEWEQRWAMMKEEQNKERQYLYQVVLSLKQEWETERSVHRG